MRVISGKLKGRKIEGFDLDGTRPTMERVKESLFAMIQDKLDDAIVLDLFAGSGNLGIEAISQGAKKAILVDCNIKAIKVIEKNVNNLNVESFTSIVHSDYIKAIERHKDTKFDIIFLDPPYKTDFIEKSIKKITEYNMLNDSGIIVCESSMIDKIVYPSIYSVIKDKKYGDKYVVILKKM